METSTSREASKKQRISRFFLLNTSSFRTALLIFGVAAVLISGGYIVRAASYTMTVSVSSGASTGKITTSPVGSPAMNCGNGASVCTASYPELASVTVQAAPASGYAFNRWSASTPAPCTNSTSASCTFTISNDISFSASFLPLYTVFASLGGTYGSSNITSSPAGISCGSDCQGDYVSGTNVVLTANPASGYSFTSWTNCPSPVGSNCNINNISLNYGVTANFVAETVYYTLTAARAGSYGSSNVTSNPSGISCGLDCSESYAYGTNVTLTANEASGYDFSSWTNCPSSSGNTCTVNINAARTVTANFVAETVYYTLTAARAGSYGSSNVTSNPSGISCGLDCSESYAYGTNVTLTANEASGYDFSSWTNCPSSSGNTCTVNINAARTVTANFVAETVYYTLTAAHGGGGVITSSLGGINCGVDCAENYAYGSTFTLTATPSAGYQFSSWTNCPSASGNTCTVSGFNANRTVTASFDVVYTVSVYHGGGGTVTSVPAGISCGADCSEGYVYGENVTLTATPSAGYQFSSWTGCSSTSGNTCYVNVNGNINVTANFTAVHTLTVQRAGTYGASSVASSPAGISCGADCDQVYTQGTNVVLTATPASGYVFVSWNNCPSTSGNRCTINNFSASRTVTANFDIASCQTTVTPNATTSGTWQVGCAATHPRTTTPTFNAKFFTFTVNATSTVIIRLFSATDDYLHLLSGGAPSGAIIQTDDDSGGGSPANDALINRSLPPGTYTAEATTYGANISGNFSISIVVIPTSFTVTATNNAASSGRIRDTYYGFSRINCGDGGTACSFYYNKNNASVMVASSTPGSWFRYWSTTGSASACDTSSSPTCSFTVTSDTNVTANYGYVLTLIKTGLGALSSSVVSTPVTGFPDGINCVSGCGFDTGKYDSGRSVTLTATPAPGYYLGWTGCTSATGTTCTVSMTSPKTVTASFSTVQYNVTVNKAGPAAAGSTVTSNPSGINCGATCTAAYASSSTVQLTATPAPGNGVVWTGCTSTSGRTCTVLVNGTKNVTATFDTQVLSGDVTGWGWSENTGWMSFNCQNLGECGTAPYGLQFVGPSLRGYVWGGHIGWIYFPSSQADGNTTINLSSCPVAGTCTPPTVNVTTGAVSGWARALAGSTEAPLPPITGGSCAAVHEDMNGPSSSCMWPIGSNQLQCDAPSAGYSNTVVYANCTTSYSKPASSRFTAEADAVCGAGNWTSPDMGPPWEWPINTVKTFTCITPVERSSGWGGWIQLSSANHPSPGSGVTYNNTTGALTGYAWGGPVVGWIDFMGTSPTNAIAPVCDFDISTLNNSISINPGNTVNNTVSVNFVSSGGVPSTYYCDKNIYLWPGNSQYDTALFSCGSNPSYEAPTSRSDINTWEECARYDNPMCYNWTVSQWIDAEAMVYACGAGNYTKLSSNSFKCNNTLSCQADLSVIAIAQGPNESDPDVKDSQYGARTFVPVSTTEATTTSALSIVSLATTPVGPYTVVVQGDNGVGLKKSASFAVNVDTPVPQCVDPVGWVEADKVPCPSDSAGLTGSVTKTLATTCSQPAGSVPKCQYTCNPATGIPDNPLNPTRCVPRPQITVKAAPTAALLSGCTDGSPYKTVTSDSVDIYSRARVLWTGANVQSCVGVTSTGDSGLPGSTWATSKVVDATPRCYTTQPLLLEQAIRSTSTCNGAEACYKFNIQCEDLSGRQAPLATVVVPLSGIGSVSCRPYDNPQGTGAPLRSIKVGQPMYWVASTTPDVPLTGGSFDFTWTGTDELSGPGTIDACGDYECNHIRYVYKSLGGKTARVRVSHGTSTATVECSAIANSTINHVFEEF